MIKEQLLEMLIEAYNGDVDSLVEELCHLDETVVNGRKLKGVSKRYHQNVIDRNIYMDQSERVSNMKDGPEKAKALRALLKGYNKQLKASGYDSDKDYKEFHKRWDKSIEKIAKKGKPSFQDRVVDDANNKAKQLLNTEDYAPEYDEPINEISGEKVYDTVHKMKTLGSNIKNFNKYKAKYGNSKLVGRVIDVDKIVRGKGGSVVSNRMKKRLPSGTSFSQPRDVFAKNFSKRYENK